MDHYTPNSFCTASDDDNTLLESLVLLCAVPFIWLGLELAESASGLRKTFLP